MLGKIGKYIRLKNLLYRLFVWRWCYFKKEDSKEISKIFRYGIYRKIIVIGYLIGEKPNFGIRNLVTG